MDDYSASSDEDESYAPFGTHHATKPITGNSQRPKTTPNRFVTESSNVGTSNLAIGQIPLVVEPSTLRFDSIRPGVLYAITFSLRNTSKIAQRVRIQAPKSPYFALNYIPTGSLAPGLDIRAEVECQIPSDCQDMFVSDVIVASMGDYAIEIPLFASKPHARVTFNQFANVGYVALGQFTNYDVYFQNEGDIKATVSFNLSNRSKIKLSSPILELRPRSKERLVLTFEAKELGPYREVVEVSINGGLSDQILDISAQVVDQKLSILAPNHNGLLDNFNFGPMFYGQKKTVTASLANTGPQPLSFSIVYCDEDNDGHIHDHDEDPNALEKTLTVFPTEGIIPPFSEIPFTLKFEPILITPKSGFSQKFNAQVVENRQVLRKLSLDSTEGGDKLQLLLQGTALLPDITISQDFLDFGDCPVNDRRDIRLTVINRSSIKANYEFTRNAQFKFTPNKGTIQPQQTISVIASFLPTQMGIFKPNLSLGIANGLRTLNLRMYGDANVIGPKRQYVHGTDKLPEDFKVEYKFVDPLALEQSRREKSRMTARPSDMSIQTASDLLTSMPSQERDLMYGLTEQKSNTTPLMGEFHPFSTKLQNDKVYNDYLQQSFKERTQRRAQTAHQRAVERGGPDRLNPDGVDLGMARGLQEPLLALPHGGEGLWMANRAGDSDRGSGRSRIPIDENRLIQKKHKSTPATQAEMRDCTAELSLDNQKMVYASHKVIDYGRVCINSLVPKNFVVTNDLDHVVMVSIQDLEPEFKQSKPETQVIPKNSIAGFDIMFCSKVLGKYKKALTWTVNGKYSHKVTILAEVVPIELVMNTSHLTFEFASDSLEPFVIRDIILSNPGNAPAEFLWGSTGSFECKPDRGVIDAGQSALISILWTPQAGRRNDEEIGLHIPGGVDKTLRVEGFLKDSKAEFEEKRINLASMAVGLEKKVNLHLKNTGSSPSVVYLNAFEDKYSIKLSPDRILISAGEVVPIDVVVCPKMPLSYDMNLTATIRGGKTFSLKLLGESIVPDISIEQTSFEFGKVAVSSNYSLPLIITNRSMIMSCMTLDLSRYSDFKPFVTSTDEVYPLVDILPMQVDADGNRIEYYSENNAKSNDNNNIWKISINPGSTIRASLIFLPTIPRSYKFALPLFMTGIMDDTRFNMPVTAESIPTRLELSHKLIDFGDKVVSRDPMSRTSYYIEFALKNIDIKQGFGYEIREQQTMVTPHMTPDGKRIEKHVSHDDEGPPVFFTSPMRNDVPAGVVCPIRITFMPKISGDYEKKLDIYISNQPDPTRPYTTIFIKGSGVYPKIDFDRNFITMPTVPLGMTSRISFTVFNRGYPSLDLRHSLSPVIPIPLQVSYPDGMELNNSNKSSVRVVVAMSSESPVSWTGKIEFRDADGERFAVTLAGCTDNSILTNYPFLNRYNDIFGFLGLDNEPVKLLKKSVILELRQLEAKKKEEMRRQRMLDRQKQTEMTDGDKQGNNNKGKGVSAKGKRSDKKDDKNMKEQPSVVSDESLKPSDIKELSNKSEPKVRSHDDGFDGIDLDRESKQAMDWSFLDSEIQVLLKWLNRFVCRRPFDTQRFPECIVECHGDVVVDCLEQMSGRKFQGVKTAAEIENTGSSSSGNANTTATTPLSSLAAATNGNGVNNNNNARAGKLLAKYQIVLNTLIRVGALLNHINPVALLGLEDHLIAQEAELKRNEGARMTSTRLSELKIKWEQSWLTNCRNGWMEVLFQAMKVYMLSRVSFKDFSQMPGVILPAEMESKGTGVNGSGKAKKKPAFPPEYSPSNVYSAHEAVLLQWITYHMQKASNLRDGGVPEDYNNNNMLLYSSKKRIQDFEVDLRDMFALCQIYHSHLPDFTNAPDGPISGYSVIDRNNNRNDVFAMLRRAMEATRLGFDLQLEDLVTARSMLIVVLHLYLNLPQLIPKSKIEFRGLLGSTIQKVIDLHNPSKRRVTYDVSVTGSSEFQIECKSFSIPPESSYEFKVSLCPRFSDPTNAMITFWGVRDSGVAGSNLVFAMASAITGRKPIETYVRDVPLFEVETISINVTNPFDQAMNCRVDLLLERTARSIEQVIQAAGGSSSNRRGATRAPSSNQNGTTSTSKTPRVGGSGGGNGAKFLKGQSDMEAALTAQMESGEKSAEDVEIEKLFIKPIWCSEDSITLPPRGSHTIQVQILPFLIGTYHSQIVFRDDNVGEFCYEIIANVGLPRPSDKLDFHCYMSRDGSLSKALRVPSKNLAFEKALNYISDHCLSNPSKKTKARSIFQSFINSPIVDQELGTSAFIAESLSPLWSVSRTLSVVSEYMVLPFINGKPSSVPSKYKKLSRGSIEALGGSESNMSNTTVVTLSADKAGSYHCQIVVYSQGNPNDVRVIELSAVAEVPDAKMTIEFRGPARQKMTQEIPITNQSNKDWTLTAAVHGQGYSGPNKALMVPKGSKVAYPLSFQGPYEGIFEGSLLIRNTDGTDSFEYLLMGIVDEPLAEDHLIFKCKARSKEKISIPVKNIPRISNKSKSKDKKDKDKVIDNNNNNNNNNGEEEFTGLQRFSIETDLPHVAGADMIEVQNNYPRFYELTVSAPTGGYLTGSVIFNDLEGKSMFWYTVEIEITSPEAERTIHAESEVRKAVVIEISLDNPTTEPLVFQVKLSGEGLIGDQVFTLPPQTPLLHGGPTSDDNEFDEDGQQTNSKYELIYSPLFPGKHQGRISFQNDKLGEFWYELDLHALESAPIILEPIEAMIGGSASVEVPIDNPLPREVTLDVLVSDPEHFSVVPSTLTLAPYAQSSFHVHFTPTTLIDTESSEIKISHNEFGSLEYVVSGQALLPGIMPETRVYSPLNELSSHSLTFRNPFAHPLPIDVVMEEEMPVTRGLKQLSVQSSKSVKSGGDNILNNAYNNVNNNKNNNNNSNNNASNSTPVFGLLLKKAHDLVIPAKATMQITFSFSPTRLGEYRSSLIVRTAVSGRSLMWCFPVLGMAEAAEAQELEPLITQCKTSLRQDAEISLFGLFKEDIGIGQSFEARDFVVESVIDESHKALVSRSFRFQILEVLEVENASVALSDNASVISKLVDAQHTRPADFKLKVRLQFEPLKTFNTTVELSIFLKNRGRWRFKLELYATDPDPDDTIQLVAPIGGMDKVSFRLNNRFLGYSAFQAYFSARSSAHFHVTPSSGVLAPYGSEGTQFIVTYAPKAYGTLDSATLIVTTEETQWTYKIIGQFPDRAAMLAQSQTQKAKTK